MNRITATVAGAVVALALFAGGYALGSSSAQARPASPSASAGGTTGGAAAGGGLRGPGAAAGFNAPVNGRIISVNADSITIAVQAPRAAGAAGQPSGSPALGSSIALVGASTRLVRTTETELKLSDLKAGDQVTVVGATDATTGTISAQAVVVGGANILGQLLGGPGGGPGGPGPGAPRPSASPTR